MDVDLLVDTNVDGEVAVTMSRTLIPTASPAGHASLIESVCATFDITQAQLARALGTTPRTVSRWKPTSSQHVEPSFAHARALRDLGRLEWLLNELAGPEHAADWMRTPNPFLRGRAPLDAVLDGDAEQVLGLLEVVAEGGFY